MGVEFYLFHFAKISMLVKQIIHRLKLPFEGTTLEGSYREYLLGSPANTTLDVRIYTGSQETPRIFEGLHIFRPCHFEVSQFMLQLFVIIVHKNPYTTMIV